LGGRNVRPSPAPRQAEVAALEDVISKGVVAVQSSRVGGGCVLDSARHRAVGTIAADNLTPQKARILLGLALARTTDRNEIQRIFATYWMSEI
jgi:L-asparaginase